MCNFLLYNYWRPFFCPQGEGIAMDGWMGVILSLKGGRGGGGVPTDRKVSSPSLRYHASHSLLAQCRRSPTYPLSFLLNGVPHSQLHNKQTAIGSDVWQTSSPPHAPPSAPSDTVVGKSASVLYIVHPFLQGAGEGIREIERVEIPHWKSARVLAQQGGWQVFNIGRGRGVEIERRKGEIEGET